MERIVIVTGAASGIGKATAEQLTAAGWQVVGLDRSFTDDFSGAGEPAGMMRAHCDVTDAASVTAAFAQIGERCGHADAIVCSAGTLATGELVGMALEDFDRIYAVNTRGAWLCACQAVALMRDRPKSHGQARIVFVGSIAGIRPKVGGGAYGAQKAALHVITGVMAAELAGDGILVNAVAPGTVNTPMIEAVAARGDNGRYRPSGTSPLGRVAEPADVANVIEFLLGEQASYVTGSVVPVDGGTRAAFVPPTS